MVLLRTRKFKFVYKLLSLLCHCSFISLWSSPTQRNEGNDVLSGPCFRISSTMSIPDTRSYIQQSAKLWASSGGRKEAEVNDSAPRAHQFNSTRSSGRKSFEEVPQSLQTDAAGSSVISYHAVCLFTVSSNGS